jgi:hypothetical protein
LIKRNLLESDDRVCPYRIWNNVLKIFFRADGPMVFCHDITGLFKGLKKEHTPSDWRLFIDSSQRSLKTVSLRNGNFKKFPIAHSAQLKGTFNNMKVLLEAIQDNVPWRSEDNRYVGGYARRLYEVLLSAYVFGIVAVQPKVISSVTEVQGRHMSK